MRTPKEDLLVGGLDDWVYASWALQSAKLTGEQHVPALIAATLTLIAEVLEEGLMVAGDVDEGRHIPWDLTASQAMTNIASEWERDWAGQVPTPGAVTWLANTEAGDRLAHAVLAREVGGGTPHPAGP